MACSTVKGVLNMDFSFRMATSEDAHRVRVVMETCHNMLEHQDFYVMDSETRINKIINTDGFVLLAEYNNNIVGFLIVNYPKNSADNYGRLLYDSFNCEAIAHMESCAVLPEYRGNGLQSKLLKMAESYLSDEIEELLTTVHPNNVASVTSLKQNGYTIRKQLLLYGGLPRFVMSKAVER